MNKAELDFILHEGEGLKIEFKENIKGIDKEIAAFANSEGGKIFLGVSDDNKLKGIKITNGLKSQIQDIANNCDPQIKVDIKQFNDILIIEVPEGEDKPYKCKEGFFVRIGPNSQKMKTKEIFEFAAKAGKIFFDELPCRGFNFKNDFDNGKFELFLKKTGISPILGAKQILTNLNLGKNEKNKFVINNAGAMLFAKDLNRIYYHTIVTCVRFKGNDRSDILDKKSFNQDILSNIENSVKFILQYLPLRYEIKTLHRKEYYEIPEDAVREAVVNAIVHRDYFERGANVQINIFDDTIEITNPGGLVAGLRKQDFGKKSLSRNPLLLSILSKTEFVEKIGSGIRRIRDAVKKQGLKKPMFEFNGFFSIIFFRPKIATSVKTMAETVGKTVGKTVGEILALIDENPKITREELSAKTGLTTRGIEWNLRKLKEEGLIQRIGPAKGGHWKITKKEET